MHLHTAEITNREAHCPEYILFLDKLVIKSGGGLCPPTYEWAYLVCTRYNLQNHNIKFVNNYPINPSTQNRI